MKLTKNIALYLLLLITPLYVWYLHQSQEPMLMYREQQQIFLWDGDYVARLLKQTGGFATLSAQFLVQFFSAPWISSVITTLSITLIGYILWLTLRRFNKSVIWFPVSMFTAYLQGMYLLEIGYHYEGLLAWLMFAIMLYLYLSLSENTSTIFKTLIGITLTLLLYVYVGSIASLFAISAFSFDMLHDVRKGWMSSVYILTCLLAALITVANGSIVGFDYALWTKGYYEYHVEQGLWQSLSWIVVPLVIIAAKLTSHIKLKPFIHLTLCIILLFSGGGFIYLQSEKKINKDFRTLTELNRSVNQEDWEGIVNDKNLNYQNYLHLNYLNLALSHQGRMMTDLFKYPQKGPQSLLVSYQAYNDINVLFSHIYYHTGVISEALCLSFGTIIATTYGNPSMLKLLVKERLIYGDYQVAEKYITRLEKTYGYKDWAVDMRKFLFNDEAVNHDPELGEKRKSLPTSQPRFVVLDGLTADLIKVVETGTEEQNALEYLMAMLMLDKNMPGIKSLVEKYADKFWHTGLPTLVQEAITTYAENDSDYCATHGVTQDTMNRFQVFRQRALEARRNGQNQQATLAQFRGTFWYYYMFG